MPFYHGRGWPQSRRATSIMMPPCYTEVNAVLRGKLPPLLYSTLSSSTQSASALCVKSVRAWLSPTATEYGTSIINFYFAIEEKPGITPHGTAEKQTNTWLQGIRILGDLVRGRTTSHVVGLRHQHPLGHIRQRPTHSLDLLTRSQQFVCGSLLLTRKPYRSLLRGFSRIDSD